MKVLIDKQILINIAQELRNKLGQNLSYFPIDYKYLIKAIDDVTTGGQLDLSEYFNTSINYTDSYYDVSYTRIPLFNFIKKIPDN